jgi:hypothetical protein
VWFTRTAARVLIDADAPPTYRIYHEGTEIANGSAAKHDDANTLGCYRIQRTADAPLFSAGEKYAMVVQWTHSAGTADARTFLFQVL